MSPQPSRLYGRLWWRVGPFEGRQYEHDARGWYHGNQRDGAWHFSDGKLLRAVGHYVVGRRVGHWTTWYASGSVASEVDWRSSRHGMARFWYRDGKPWWQGRYRKGIPVGTWIHWDTTGRRREVDAARESVGPLSSPPAFYPLDDVECPYRDVRQVRSELAKRSDIVETQVGTTITFTKANGFVLGTVNTHDTGGEIIDENGELVVRAVEERGGSAITYRFECRDEGGRRVHSLSWYSDHMHPDGIELD